MRLIQLIHLLRLALMLTLSAQTRAEIVDFSWWNDRYATPGIFSYAAGGYTRDARLPDEEEDIQLVINDSSWKTNSEVAGVLVVPPGTDVIGPNAFTARAQSDFGQNHAATRTTHTGFGESENREFFDNRSHSMAAESLWMDQWTFAGAGVGSATVTLSASFDVNITSSPCGPNPCEGVINPIFTRQGLRTWWYRIYGSVRVFDLDIIDRLFQPDSDEYPEVPRQVAAFEVFQQGANEDRDSFGPLEPYTNVLNARLAPIQTNGTASFVPVAGHRYAVVGQIHIQSREGADVDAGHTLSLDQVLLGQGLRLNSVAITNGARFKVFTTAQLTVIQTGGNEVMLSFPSATEFTYFVEFKNALDASAWTSLTSRTGNGNVQNVSDSLTDGAARFYRLRVQ